MLAQLELTPARAEALARLEQQTGEKQAVHLGRAVAQYLQRKADEAELLAAIEQGRADFTAGRVCSSAEVMAAAMGAITEAKMKAGK